MGTSDPYYEWLDIFPRDQPPDHYRLLGIERFVGDPGVIAGAAKRQMARVKASQAEGDSELAERVLREIAIARNHLLDPKRKAEYDRTLKPRPKPGHTSQQAAPSDGPSGPGETRRGGTSKRKSPLVPLILGGIAGTLLAATILYVIRSRQVSTAERVPLPAAESHPNVSPARPDPDVSLPQEQVGQAGAKDSQKSEKGEGEGLQTPEESDTSLVPETAEFSESDALADDRQGRPGGDGTSDSEARDGQSAEDAEEVAEAPSEPEPEQPQRELASASKKPPVPDNTSRQQAEQRVRELLQSEFDGASTPEQKAALATRLVKLGRETTGDPTTRFVLFRLAYELETSLGDWAKALTIVDTIGQHYEADVLSVKADVLGEVAERLQVTPQTSESVKQVLSAVSEGLDEAVAADNYNAANRLLRSARVVARKVGNPAMTRELGVRDREIGRMERAFDRVKTALELVAQGTADAGANLEAGRWYCFEKGNWQKGLPLLAKGSDPILADRARRDLANPEDLQQQAQLAEHWLAAAASEPRSIASAMLARAQHWCDQAMPKLDDALRNDDYQIAGPLLAAAVSVARETDDRELVTRLTSRRKEIERIEQRFAAIQADLKALAENPENAEPNLAVGQWYCFDKGNWAKGLPLLAKGGDPALTAVARRDLAGPDTPEAQLATADAWWDLAETRRDAAQSAMRARAVHWYAEALPKLAGLDKAKAETRVQEVAAAATGSGRTSRGGLIQKGNVALASNGTSVSGVITHAENLLDGNSTTYDGTRGFAFARWPSRWVITFDKVYRLQEIRFLLWDGDDRFSRYGVAVSADGQEYTPLVDRSQGPWRSWQTVNFAPRPVKAITLLGLYNSEDKNFFVVEFEAYCIPPEAK